MHDKIIIFARFTNTQKVPKPEVVGSKPLCCKWMSRGDGVEIDSAISSTALSLHNLHSCKIWRYFIQLNYHSGSAREAISVASPNASQTLFVRMRSLDECQVAVRSHKADFLSRMERRECVELMRVARYFMSGSDIACFTFVTKWWFFG